MPRAVDRGGHRPSAQAGPGEAFMEILGEMLHCRTNSSNIVHAIVAARALARRLCDCHPSLPHDPAAGAMASPCSRYTGIHWSGLGAGTAKK